MIVDNLGLAYKRFHIYKHSWPLDPHDLLMILFEALCRAAQKYRPESRVKFSTFATVCMANAYRDEMKKYRRRREVFVLDLFPGDTELSEEKAFEIIGSYAGFENSFIEKLTDEEIIDCARHINTFLQRDIILGFLEHPEKTFSALAEEVGCTRQYVGRIIREFGRVSVK